MTSTASPRESHRGAELASSAELAVYRLEHLNEIARLLAGFETVEQTFDAALAVVAKTLPLESAILIEDVAGARRTTIWGAEGPRRLTAKAHMESAYAYLGGAAQGEQSEHHGLSPLPGQPAGSGLWTEDQRFIVLPLVVANRPIFGALQVEAGGFDKLDLVFITAVACQLAVALDRDRVWRRDVARREHAELMEATLRSQTDALTSADHQRSEFLSVLAEELRSSVGNLAEIQHLVRSAAAGDRIDRAVAALGAQMTQMNQLVSDLTGLSSLTREQAQVRKFRVEIGAILTRAAGRGTERLFERGQTLTVSIPPEPAFLEADAARLESVFDTLIDKASLLATPVGRIWLSARLIAAGNNESLLPGVPQFVVTLRDDGAGQDTKSVMPRVHDLLTPSGRPLDPADFRFGAGLKLMRRVVELHGGVVRAMSAGVGQGSEFELRLPIGGRHNEMLGPERRSS